MTLIAVATDNIRTPSLDEADCEKFCQALRNAGYEVVNAGRGPNRIQNYCLVTSAGGQGHQVDVMIQIAGGLCCGTLGDFIKGIKNQYYRAKKGAIVYNTVAISLDAKTYGCDVSHDWGNKTREFINAHYGETYPHMFEQFPDQLVGFADGESIDEVINNFLKVLGGGTNTQTNEQQQSGGTVIDLIKQVCTDLNPYGVELELIGDEVHIHKSHPEKAVAMNESHIINNSVSFTDYDSDTPNTNGKVKDKYLVDRFGTVELETDITDDQAQVLQIAKRGHGHSLDLKCVLDYRFIAGNWVSLTLPSLKMKDRLYYISKASYDSEMSMSLTLDPAPPSLYAEMMDVTEEETTEEENSEEESSEEEGSEETTT